MHPILLLHLLISMATAACTTQDHVQAELLIRNIKQDKGTFIISFYDEAAAFPKVGKELLIEKVEVKDTLPHIIHVNVPKEGWYAIAMFQDEDDNGKIKQDKIGVPEEPYAFSNNIHPKVAAPNFTLCKFYVSKEGNKQMEIRLIQPRFGGRL